MVKEFTWWGLGGLHHAVKQVKDFSADSRWCLLGQRYRMQMLTTYYNKYIWAVKLVLESPVFCGFLAIFGTVEAGAISVWKSSLVQFLTPRVINRNHNWSFYFRKPKKTRPNWCGPVHISFLRSQDWLRLVTVWTSLKLVQTSLKLVQTSLVGVK